MDAIHAIKNRKTEKVLANAEAWPVTINDGNLNIFINELLDLAGSAPFHYPCNEKHTTNCNLTSSVPWRFYVVDTKNCRLLLEYLNSEKLKSGKIANMLAAADALLLTTWLPEPITQEDDSILFNGNIKNMEHIAASSAAIQNVLVGATARNIPNYWSSGGILRTEKIASFLKISLDQILLGALFLFPEDSSDKNATIKPGALRNKGKEKNTWSKWISL